MLGARIVGEAMNGGIIELLTIEDIFYGENFHGLISPIA